MYKSRSCPARDHLCLEEITQEPHRYATSTTNPQRGRLETSHPTPVVACQPHDVSGEPYPRICSITSTLISSTTNSSRFTDDAELYATGADDVRTDGHTYTRLPAPSGTLQPGHGFSSGHLPTTRLRYTYADARGVLLLCDLPSTTTATAVSTGTAAYRNDIEVTNPILQYRIISTG
jgi:hypothetical protein